MSNSRSKRHLTFARGKAVRRVFIGLVALLLLYGLFGYFVLPAIVKAQTQTLIEEKLHRRATLGRVEINPFTLVLTLRDFKLMEADGDTRFASFDTLTVNLSAASALHLAPVIKEVRLAGPYVHVVRRAAHSYNFDDLTALASGKPSSGRPARFSVSNIQLEQGRIDFDDLPARASHAITGLSLGIPFISSLPAQADVFVEPLLRAQVDGATLLARGKARPFAEPREAVVELNLDSLDLAPFVDYLPAAPRFHVPSARLEARLQGSFRQPRNEAPSLILSGDLALKALQIKDLHGAPVLKLPELALSLANTDVTGGRVELTKAVATGLEADLRREPDGRLNLQHLLPASRETAAQAEPASPLHVTLGELDIRGGMLHYTDSQPARPMRAGLEKLDLTLRGLVLDTVKKTLVADEVVSDSASLFLRQDKRAERAEPGVQPAGAASPAPEHAKPAAGSNAYAMRVDRLRIENWTARVEDHNRPEPAVAVIAPLSLSLHGLSTASQTPAQMALKASVNRTGRVLLNGSVGLAPFRTDLALDLDGVDLLPLQPLIADRINLRFTGASLSGKGRLQLATGKDGELSGGFRGDASLNDLAAADPSNGRDFLRWKSLFFGGMEVRLQPFAMAVDNMALRDFFARVIIDPSGRINLQNIVRSRSAGPNAAPANAGRASGGNAQGRPASVQRQMPPVSIRRLTFQGGRVRFSDNFIRPNYSASLMNFSGVVTGLSSDPSATANVNLRGEVNRAPLSIAGRVNPLRGDLFLDLNANVRGMELATLSAYADRYLGYGIEKGKLSFEVNYHVENRQLSATNRLILDQLTLNEASASNAATRLPVKLAVALLQDRNGVIDVNVPIEGSLDDPQFSIGGIILKVIGNAVVKAVSQPFALLGSVFGGGSGGEMSSVSFEPGRAAITPATEAKLRSLASALANRPALKLDITGWAGGEADLEGLKRVAIERKVRALKLQDLRARGQAAELASVSVNADEYPALLGRVYREEKFPKPRNLIGLQKRLPVEEMERLMMAHTEIDDSDLIGLANRRAQAVKDWLTNAGQVTGERIFILASRSGQSESKQGEGAAPQNRVDFSLR
ncbi:DUF748 domain-containing protein [Noviherbaspirillum massiliense]|uniref:DUF748 domain-containing protein n=1 Tax=Noviherbaspirillum massiliense TaxID=1465823 RepID=UPI0002FAF958|nr:DUF748 domain-containing protein [Noviherbaspirillum massiliense]